MGSSSDNMANEAKKETKLPASNAKIIPTNAAEKPSDFGNSPFAQLDTKLGNS